MRSCRPSTERCWSWSISRPWRSETLAESVRANYYPAPNEREVLRDEALTVDGAPAWVYEFVLSWDVAGYDATGERAALVVIDTGRAAPPAAAARDNSP